VALVKICGIRSWDDAAAAVDAGADILGFVCDAHSPRLIDPYDFIAISLRLPATVQRVGVFHRAPSEAWRTVGREVFQKFHQIQYADDTLWTTTVKDNWDMRRKIRSFRLTSPAGLREVANFNGLVQSYLLNVHLTADRGYMTADEAGWDLACDVWQFGKKIYLAGGLTPDNVARAISKVQPFAVDVTVGVESEPGIKDHALMRKFVKAARSR
jgi:phosphoribosylanthranilate isomerase